MTGHTPWKEIRHEPVAASTDWLGDITKAAEASLRDEVVAVRSKRHLDRLIVAAYGQVRMVDLVQASGLTRQRLHQIIKGKR